MPEDQLGEIVGKIQAELDSRVMELRSQGRLLEAQRLMGRTKYDLELIQEVGFCPGIENYSRFFDGRQPGERPYTLMDYFDYAPPGEDSDAAMQRRSNAAGNPSDAVTQQRGNGAREADEEPFPMRKTADSRGGLRPNFRDWLLIIDESHVTIPQIRAMYNGDRNRKMILVEHGFRFARGTGQPSHSGSRSGRRSCRRCCSCRRRPGRTSWSGRVAKWRSR
jgi:excinuclease ABC subunit B